MTLKKNFMDDPDKKKRPASAAKPHRRKDRNNENKTPLDINSVVDTISFLERTDIVLDERSILPQTKKKRLFSATMGVKSKLNRDRFERSKDQSLVDATKVAL